MRIGVDRYYDYFQKFGLLTKTGVDLPGEAGTIMHKKENIGAVELATISFGQSFQITPIQLATTASSIVNGGNRVTPHFGVKVVNGKGETVENLQYPVKKALFPNRLPKPCGIFWNRWWRTAAGKTVMWKATG